MCYNQIMEQLKKVISTNICKLRKSAGMTQVALAEKLNYSDKAVSRWEKGEVVPDVETLYRLGEVFGVNIEYFFSEHINYDAVKEVQKQQMANKIATWITLISFVWVVFTVAFVYLQIYHGINQWQLFVWGVPFTCIVSSVCNKKWGNKTLGIYISSVLIWSLLASIYLQFLSLNLWPIFIVGVPLQVAVIFSHFIFG